MRGEPLKFIKGHNARGKAYSYVPVEDRFWEKLEPEPNTGCWLWTAAINGNGYGLLGTDDGKLAHRAAFIMLRGEIPDGLELDHLCRVRRCVNPWHTEPVTHAENMRRSGIALCSDRCIRGHDPSELRYRRGGRGNRYCNACQREAKRWQRVA